MYTVQAVSIFVRMFLLSSQCHIDHDPSSNADTNLMSFLFENGFGEQHPCISRVIQQTEREREREREREALIMFAVNIFQSIVECYA